jgi:hypothetical protein
MRMTMRRLMPLSVELMSIRFAMSIREDYLAVEYSSIIRTPSATDLGSFELNPS